MHTKHPPKENQATPPVLCIDCAHHYLPPRCTRIDNVHWCANGARRNVVTGEPAHEDCVDCYRQRAKTGRCGPQGVGFANSLSAVDFNRISNPADFTIDSHSLDESGQKHGVFSGEPVAEHSVDLANGDAQVLANDAARADDGLVDY